jgi:hypothetical protein
MEAVLDRAVGDGNSEIRFPAPGLSTQDQTAAVRDEIGGECCAQERQTDGRLDAPPR